jgi:hypothetical protein
LGIHSDHSLNISRIDLGIENFEVSKDCEERIDFKRIMNISVRIKVGDDHPTLSDTVYKGADFRLLAQLNKKLQQTVNDSNNEFMNRIRLMQQQLVELEKDVIHRTKLAISNVDQVVGKLIQRTKEDVEILNTSSKQIFTLINDIRCAADLASMVPIIPSNVLKCKKSDIAAEKLMPGIA